MKMKFTHVKEDVQKTLEKIGVTPDAYAVFAVWEKEAGRCAGGCRDITLRNGILYADIDSPVIIQELVLRKRAMIRTINNHFARPMVKDIRYRPSRDPGGPS